MFEIIWLKDWCFAFSDSNSIIGFLWLKNQSMIHLLRNKMRYLTFCSYKFSTFESSIFSDFEFDVWHSLAKNYSMLGISDFKFYVFDIFWIRFLTIFVSLFQNSMFNIWLKNRVPHFLTSNSLFNILSLMFNFKTKIWHFLASNSMLDIHICQKSMVDIV